MLVVSMRAGGAKVGIGKWLAAHRALGALDPTNHESAYLALRASLCARDDDAAPFDAAFAEWFSRPTPRLQEKDFAEYSEADRRAARAVMRRLAGAGPARPSRRTPPARRRGPRPHAGRSDLRRTIRSSLRTGGDPFERHWGEPGDRPRRLVFIYDVSDAMEPYARMLLEYMKACVAAGRRVEVLDALNREHEQRLGRGAIVVLLSDGLDRGDPDRLWVEMARLGRSAHSLVWLNPLEAHRGTEPLTIGVQAALAHVDHLLAGNSLASLEELAQLVDDGLE
jgi:uncharacterized protein with von Willebrand factor type A (vWA) domain